MFNPDTRELKYELSKRDETIAGMKGMMSYLIEEKTKKLEEDIRQLPHNSRIEFDPRSGMEAVLKPEVLAKSMEKERQYLAEIQRLKEQMAKLST